MDALIEAIRAAVVPDASDEARAAGAGACRTLLAALETTPGQPMAAAEAPPIVTAVAALRGVPPDQLLDLAITKLRSLVPADAPAPRRLQIPIVKVPSR